MDGLFPVGVAGAAVGGAVVGAAGVAAAQQAYGAVAAATGAGTREATWFELHLLYEASAEGGEFGYDLLHETSLRRMLEIENRQDLLFECLMKGQGKTSESEATSKDPNGALVIKGKTWPDTLKVGRHEFTTNKDKISSPR